MEAGERWMLNDVSEKPISSWDSRGHIFRTNMMPFDDRCELSCKGPTPLVPTRKPLPEKFYSPGLITAKASLTTFP